MENINTLVVFLSCKKNNKLWDKLLNIDINSILFYGDNEIDKPFIFNNRILTLKCKDTYDYLPVKIYLMIKAILQIEEFKNITHIIKVDDWDTKIDNNIHNKLERIVLSDYCGQKFNNQFFGDRRYHYNKCPIDSIWHNTIYRGEYVPWLDGGCGYILSRNAMNIISNEYTSVSDIHKSHIYEDTMIALILRKHHIFPKKINKIIVGDK
jgi:hypothetical protein